MEQELLPHRPAGPEERWSHTLARAHSLSLSLTLSFSRSCSLSRFGFSPPSHALPQHPPPSWAGVTRPVRGPSGSAGLGAQLEAHLAHVNRAGQGMGRAAPSPRSRTAALGPCHPTCRAAVPSLVLPAGRGSEAVPGARVEAASSWREEREGRGPGAVTIPSTCGSPTWGAAEHVCMCSRAQSSMPPAAPCHGSPWSGGAGQSRRGCEQDGSQVLTTGDRPPRRVP